MKFKWWGQAAFTITTAEGTKIVTDPYGEDFPYKSIEDKADIVTVSHDHFDHNGVENVAGDFEVVKTVEGINKDNIKIKGIATYHDDAEGKKRGENNIYVMETEEMTICHFGDLGHPLTAEQKQQLQGVEVMLIPVGGNFTINARQAYDIIQELKPAAVIPMHFKTEKIDLPIEGVEPFLNKFRSDQVKRTHQSEIELKELPAAITIYLLDYV